jgi:ABC-type molybdate transport system permease subunit
VTILFHPADSPAGNVDSNNWRRDTMIKKLAAALVFAVVIASGMGTFSTTVHAAGHVPGYCRFLPSVIQAALNAGETDFAALLQGIFDANCL